ncbi:hypothetical protein Hamer_G002922 [Homarus americanus]|uniref:Uncharacterized protein n=1 Tax=Homarus americanus TaxID=6706 RepID=A0A8J5JT94_HOMAM|nr:hypothetical protein Hamer_G002922 [Homarus americanus]
MYHKVSAAYHNYTPAAAYHNYTPVLHKCLGIHVKTTLGTWVRGESVPPSANTGGGRQKLHLRHHNKSPARETHNIQEIVTTQPEAVGGTPVCYGRWTVTGKEGDRQRGDAGGCCCDEGGHKPCSRLGQASREASRQAGRQAGWAVHCVTVLPPHRPHYTTTQYNNGKGGRQAGYSGRGDTLGASTQDD